MYTKIFKQILNSSITEDYMTRFVFQDLLLLADRRGIVDMTIKAIAGNTQVPEEIIRQAIAKLESPDPRSRNPNCDGRRIVRLDSHRDWGWLILNYEFYDNLRSAEERRTYFRDYQRRRRKRQKVENVDNCGHQSTHVNNVTPLDSESTLESTPTPPTPSRGNVCVAAEAEDFNIELCFQAYQKIYPQHLVTRIADCRAAYTAVVLGTADPVGATMALLKYLRNWNDWCERNPQKKRLGLLNFLHGGDCMRDPPEQDIAESEAIDTYTRG